MDHLEEDQERTTVPQQEQTQQRRQGRQQPPQQQWQQQQHSPGYAVAQQPHYTAPARRQYPADQDMPPSQAGAAIMQPPIREMEYRSQHASGASANYPVQGAASYAGGYSQHYQQASQQMYHRQAQMALQQPIQMQQHPMSGVAIMGHQQQQHHPQPYIQPTAGRLPADRPLVKLSVSLIDTYKHINRVYYEERDARRAARAAQKAQKGQGAQQQWMGR